MSTRNERADVDPTDSPIDRGSQKNSSEPGHGPVFTKSIDEIYPSFENDRLYRPVDPNDPDIQALAASISEFGIKEPIVTTEDGFIVSGHRRFSAAKVAGCTTVPCRIEPIRRRDEPDRFVRLLREYNRQREKSFAEKLREEVVSADPTEAYDALIEHRRKQAEVAVPTIALRDASARCSISKAKFPFLNAVKKALADRRAFWPLSDRMIHYALLNAPPLRHDSKPASIYTNSPQAYKSLVDLLTRARIQGFIPMDAIADETRPVVKWDVYGEPGAFIRKQLGQLFKGYWRNLMQSQPNHIEILGEKNTVASILKTVAAKYCIPLTTGRGYCSLPPRAAMAERFKASGKDQLVVLIVSDFDPDGEEIAHSFARSMRDDFGVESIQPIKVALTAEQVKGYRLIPSMEAKKGSTNFKRFTAKYGKDVFELEALAPTQLQEILAAAIDSVIDVEAFNAEVDAEKVDAGYLEGVRRTITTAIGEMNLGSEEGAS